MTMKEASVATAVVRAAAAVNVLITYHSVTGNTEKMAQGVADGAKEVSAVNVALK